VSWYTDHTNTWKFRRAIAINGPGGTPGAPDLTHALKSDDAHFWANVQSDGDDVRITSADGRTLKTYQYSVAFNASTRVGTIQVDDGAAGDSTHVGVCWLYYGNSTVSAGSGSFVAGTMWDGYTLPSRPAPDRVLTWHAEVPGVTAAADRVQKTANETILVAIRYRDVLAKRRVPYGGSLFEEEPSTLTYGCYDAGSAQAAMIDLTAIRLDNDFLYVLLKAGASGSIYTVRVVMVTTGSNTGLGRTLEYAFQLHVQTPTE
jgi:hypothetical protein